MRHVRAEVIRRRSSSMRASVRATSIPPQVVFTPRAAYWRWLSRVSIAISRLWSVGKMKFDAWPVNPPGLGSGPLSMRTSSRQGNSARWATSSEADRHQGPVASDRLGDIAPEQVAHLAPPHPRHEEQPRDHRVELAALQGDLVGFDGAAGTPRPVAGGENRGEVSRHEGAGLAAAGGGPPVAGEHRGGAFAGGTRLASEAGPETRRGHRRRRARRALPCS